VEPPTLDADAAPEEVGYVAQRGGHGKRVGVGDEGGHAAPEPESAVVGKIRNDPVPGKKIEDGSCRNGGA